ncbi:MAG: hypothetical protein H6728_07885 [Myxococcales bacterium]|nr:hypothetical protein [Myxococcales bacterium]MCB9642979.1 hypothetical protein [Myxococcales bacterium]
MLRSVCLMVVIVPLWLLCVGEASAQPSESRCMQLWKKGAHETVLRCKARGGERLTRSLQGRRYRGVVGTCWDYDLVVQQSCGCRLFKRASICCWRDRPGVCPDFRVGASQIVKCGGYGAPRYGASGATMNARCQKRAKSGRRNRHCGRAIVSGKAKAFTFFSCRDAVLVQCKKESQFQPIFRGRCGPGVGGCRGCRLMDECNSSRAKKCYREGLTKEIVRRSRRKRRLSKKYENPVPRVPHTHRHHKKSMARQVASGRGLGLDGGTKGVLRALIARLSMAAKNADVARFQANWHPAGYQVSLSGYGYYAGKAIYRTCKAYRYQIIPSFGAAQAAAGGKAWILPVSYRERGKSYDAEQLFLLVSRAGGGWKALAAHKSAALLRTVAAKHVR